MNFDRKKLLKDIKDSGLMNAFIADNAGIHRSYLWMIKSGKREPTKDILRKIYYAIGRKYE